MTHTRRSAEVRKGCVFVYVELYKVTHSTAAPLSLDDVLQVLGDGLQPHLKGLSASQVMRRVVEQFCIWRLCAGRADGWAG